MAITAVSAILIDILVFKRVRARGGELSMVFASFGVAMIIRNVLGLMFGLQAKLYSQDIVFAVVFSQDPFLLVKPDQIFLLDRSVGDHGDPASGAGSHDLRIRFAGSR